MTEHIKSEVAAYLTGGLTEARNRQVEAHAAACDKCRQILAKARAKQARQNREALKKASPDTLPNLFLARQGKEAGFDRPVSKAPWILAWLLLLGGTAYWLARRSSSGPGTAEAPSLEPATSVVEVSSSIPVAAPPATVPPKPVEPKPPAVPLESPYPLTLQVIREWRGADSGIKTNRLVVVRNQDTWQKLWEEMQEKSPLPEVNFDKQVVVGVFGGELPTHLSPALGRITELEEDVVVPYRIASSSVTLSTSAVPTHPYLLSVMPRVNKKIRLTQKEALP